MLFNDQNTLGPCFIHFCPIWCVRCRDSTINVFFLSPVLYGGMVAYIVQCFISWHGGIMSYTVQCFTHIVAWCHCTMFYIVACLRATPLDLSSKKQASRATWKQMINTPTFEISMWSIQRFWDHVKLKSVNRYSLSCIRTEATLYFGWSRGHNLLCCHIIFQFQYKIIICTTICTIRCVVT